MKVLNLIFVLSIFVIGTKVDSLRVLNALTDWTSVFHSVGKHVNVLFSPNVFEAYSFKLESMSNIIDNKKFNKYIPTVIYIHGWLNSGEFEESVMAVRSAYRDQSSHNFIAIDWSAYSRWHVPVPYKSSAEKLKSVCIMIAEQLEDIRKRGCSCYKNFYLVGHSLGGQCAGLVGRHLRKISKNQFVIPRIYALDPAGPGFEFKTILGVTGFDCISKSDADYVQIIHTNGGDLGIMKSVGHADFYPNGGEKQPACKINSCHHRFGWIFFQQSVRLGTPFLARECDSYSNFMEGNCDDREIVTMGYTSDGSLPMGKFYLRTHPSSYGSAMGWDGIKTNSFNVVLEDGSSKQPLGNIPYKVPPPDNLQVHEYQFKEHHNSDEF